VTATETYAWVSYWDAASAGNWIGNEDIPNQSATSASPLNIAVGTILVTDRKAIDFTTRKFLFEIDPDGSKDGWAFNDAVTRGRTANMRNIRATQKAKAVREGHV